jgi:alkanesulfonate monooxygenase SsuD/methylene tetrahydromethanopterin reductase-like flavin-dependent oxidoreductase (luciferase family)
MRVAVAVAGEQPPDEAVAYVREAERLGVAVCWVPEAWGSDAPSVLGYLAAHTSRMLLGSGILQLGARSAALTAMTALTLARLSGDRFILGLGASGPQVMEGLHGVPFAHPLGRMRDTVEVIRRPSPATGSPTTDGTCGCRCPGARGRPCASRCPPTRASRSIWPPCRRGCSS